MNAATPPSPPTAPPVRASMTPPTPPPPPPPPPSDRMIIRYIGAFLGALAMQFAALVAVLTALFVAWAASMEDLHTRADHSDSTLYLTIPIGLIALALWIGSGFVAARITGNRYAWFVIALIPITWITLVIMLG